jgi:RNA polymerase sigma factor (sigma-70 family)
MATVAPEIPALARDEAFEKLYRRYVKDVYHYALALLRNPADAEDVTQTTFLNAYRAYQRGDEILKPQNWLIKIAHNVARTRYARISRRVKEVPLEDHIDQLAIPEEERPNVEGVLRALGRLPFNQRAALTMRELEGRSYAEIADTLGVSVAAVETLIFRARRSLRVRTATLRSILTIPLPSSLAPLVDGGGAAVGGVGAGMVIKAAVALVVGGVATGLGIERSTRAAAPPQPAVAVPAQSGGSATVARHGAAQPQKTLVVRVARSRSARVARGAAGLAPHASSHQTSTTSPVTGSGEAAAAVPAPASSALPSPPKQVDDVVATVDQTVSQVTTALPVTVPQVPPLPVQPPPVPKLP